MVLPLSQSDVQSQLSAWPAWVDTRKGLYREKQRFQVRTDLDYRSLTIAVRSWLARICGRITCGGACPWLNNNWQRQECGRRYA